ncbi:MAG: cyclic nucleotide-binding domain-containing protein [Syntrophobacterales bacterium]|nr:MAG: cyclic nucleotide-binding domain-containing protein [Syntrophobacterales bacterium]
MVSEKALIKSRAQKYLSKGNYKKALGEFQKIVQLDPTNFRARLKVGDLLHKLGRDGEAIAQYKQLARQYVWDGFLIQAISLNKIILRIDPSQEGIDRELADLYAQAGASSQIPAEGQTVERKLPEIPLFSDLNRNELHEVISHLKAKRVAKEKLVCKEGDPGDSIYIISSGKVGILKYSIKKQGDILLAKLGEGDFFGEFGFFSDRKRHATVKALTDLEVLEISRDDFDEIAKVHPRIRNVLIIFYKKRIIDTLLAFSPLFGQLQPHQRAQLVSRFKLRRIEENSLIFEQGAPPTSFFMIKSGEIEVFASKRAEPKVTLGYLRGGDFFGEISLIFNRPRMASVRTTKTTELLELEKADFDRVVEAYPPIKGTLEALSRKRLKATSELISSSWAKKATAAMV